MRIGDEPSGKAVRAQKTGEELSLDRALPQSPLPVTGWMDLAPSCRLLGFIFIRRMAVMVMPPYGVVSRTLDDVSRTLDT